jgi:erythronate-4-phosphate dehydrogenase
MKIVCSSSMPYVQDAFATLGESVVRDGRAISPADVKDAEALAIRSTTRVNRELLHGSAVRFVGTATIGTDHLDIGYLEQNGIAWCYSPGCNADSVAEYITAALLCLASRHELSLQGMTIGVVGVGNVGSRVVRKAEALGMRVLQNDPPRQRAEGSGRRTVDGGRSPDFVGLDRVLAEADIVTMHVPLTREGQDATHHLADAAFFERMKAGTIFINSARGAVVDTDALLAAMNRGTVMHTVVDTWEGEPDIRVDLLTRVDIGTPHIAGYSFDGKVKGTVMVYREACRFLGVPPAWSPDELLPPPLVPHARVESEGRSAEAALWTLVRSIYDIESDDTALRSGASGDLAAHFDSLRKNYPVRREFRFTEVAATAELRRRIVDLGFSVQQ